MTTYWVNIYARPCAGAYPISGKTHDSREAAMEAQLRAEALRYSNLKCLYRIKITIKENEDARQRTRDVPAQTSGYSYAGYKNTEGRGKFLR